MTEKETPNQGAKYDYGKPLISLVPPQIIRDIAVIREYATKVKYGDAESWGTVELDRWVDAFLRHTLDFMEDWFSKDKESGHYHFQHMACNLAFMCVRLHDIVDKEQEETDGR